MPYPISISTTNSNMTRPLRSPMPWPAYPDIPIYLEASDERATAKTYGTTPTTPTTPDIAPEILSNGRPTHLSPGHFLQPSPSPIDPSPTTTIQTSSDRFSIWPIPEPPPEIQHQPTSRRPTLRFFPAQRPRVRLDHVPALQIPQVIPQINEKTPISSIHPGLGIINGPQKPPSIEISAPAGEEDLESSRNIAERIEKRLYQYSISGNIIKRWLLEIISWIFSAVCMTAVITVLVYFKDDPLSKWSLVKNTGLTLNAYISILSKMAGAALILPVSEALGQLKWSWFQQNSKQMWDFEIFDNASRGPWGSFLLLMRTKGKALAALGAMITLCMMALDPFFQQVVDFPDRWALQETFSSIPRATHYEPVLSRIFREGELMASVDQELKKVIGKFAFDNGTQPVLFGNGTRPDIPLSCPTSNCTWPPYETLGVCSQCADISSLLNFTCVNQTVDWTSELGGGYQIEKTYPNATMCGYFLNSTSDHPVMMSGYLYDYENSTKGEALVMRALPLTTVFDKEQLYGQGTLNYQGLRHTIADFLVVTAADGTAASVYHHERPNALECVLSWCVQTLQSSYDEGRYSEEIIDVTFNNTATSSPWVAFPYETETLNGTDIFYMEDVNIHVDKSNEGRNASDYGLSNDTQINVLTVFMEILPSFLTAPDENTPAVMRYNTYLDGAAWIRELDFNAWLAPNNITSHMERLATAMTNVVRSSPNTDMLAGSAFSMETYVAVRWEWLTLPLGLLLLSLVFLAATIFKSSLEKDQVGILKNSAILTLLYGLPDEMKGKLTRSMSTGTPRAKAKEFKVKLGSNMGWRFSGYPFSPFTQRPPQKQPPPGWI